MSARSSAKQRLMACAAAIVSLLAAIVMSAQPASAAFPGYDGKIAFERYNQSQPYESHIWTMNANGTGLTRLTTAGSDNAEPAWSSDGKKIAFTSNRGESAYNIRNLYVMNADGSNQVRLTTDDRYIESPSWSPDGTKLVYTSNPITNGTTRNEIRTLDLATGLVTPLVSTTPAAFEELKRAEFSPDGNRVAWIAQRSTVNSSTSTWTYTGYSRLMVANSDGSNRMVLKEYAFADLIGARPGMMDLSWHPDSQSVNLLSRYAESPGSSYLAESQLRVVDYTGEVLYDRVTTDTSSQSVLRPSPTDNLVVLADVYGIALKSPQGGLIRRLTNNFTSGLGMTHSDIQPAWQPSATITYPLDFSLPSISISAPQQGAEVLQGASVTATYTCSDFGSPVTKCQSNLVADKLDTATLGARSFTVTSEDSASNSTTRTINYTVVAPPDVCANIPDNQASIPAGYVSDGNGNCVLPDTTPPTITVTSPTSDVLLGSSATAQFTCVDNVAVASCAGTVANGAALNTATVGAKSFTITATDTAGLQTVKLVTYNVIWPFGGFTGPVDGPPTLNSGKAGGVVPVKFSLGGDRGLAILATGYPKSVKITCSTGGAVDALEEYASTPGNNTLSYDQATQQYGYNWKTDKSWAGTCRQFIVKLADGSTAVANFQFK